MQTNSYNIKYQNNDYISIKTGIALSDYMKNFVKFLKLRSSRGYGSRKSAYSYYIRNT
jgi:hypothetical protein